MQNKRDWQASSPAIITTESNNTSPYEVREKPAAAASPTNDEFLKLMFGEDIDEAVVCSSTTPPDTDNVLASRRMWKVTPLSGSRGHYKNPARQNYTCVSSFHSNQDGSISRKLEKFKALHFIVLDDIGSKVTVDPRHLGLGEPTCIIETSPGNHQWFYRLTEPLRNASEAAFLMKQVLATSVQGHEMTDQGAKGITRLCKLPQGMNLKRKLGTPWQNRVISWCPDLSYTAQEIAGWFKQSLDRVPQIRTTPAALTEVSSQHPLILALRAEGLLKTSKPSNTGWWDITCPQVDDHTDQLDNGTAVMVRSDGSWTLKCQHGHCSDLKPQNLYDLLVEQGHCLHTPNQRDHEMLKAEFDVVEESTSTELSLESQKFKPIIRLRNGEIPQAIRAFASLLSDVVYKRGGLLVRIGLEPVPQNGQHKMDRQAVMKPVTVNWLIRELAERAMLQKWDVRGSSWVPTDCPTRHANTLVDGTDDTTFKHLTTLSTVPFLREDGTVCETQGYDEATGIFFAPSMQFPKLSEHPDHAEARVALDEILDLVKQFPFANEVSRSVLLADVLTALARPTLSKSPMVLYTASMAGSGKTLLASIANLIAYGHATNHPWPNGNEDELRKVFTSVLMAGDPVIVFDNIPNGATVTSAALSQFVTSEEYADRKLGESERLKFINRTRIVLTGNNVTLASDNARRTIVCELLLNVESLRDRKVQFEHPSLVDHIKNNRAKLIMAGLTVLRAYALHAPSLSLQPLESFEDWSRRVRDALVWLGEVDPVAAVDYSNDGSGELGLAFEAIYKAIDQNLQSRSKNFMANHLARLVADDFALREALSTAGCSEPSSSNALGCWLRASKNRIAAGYQLLDTKKQSKGGVVTWTIALAAQDACAADLAFEE